MKDAKKSLSFVVHPEGYIALDNFTPRTLYEALSVFLEKDWDKSREALSKSLMRSADLLTMVLNIRDDFERQLLQKTDKAAKKLEKEAEKLATKKATAKNRKANSDVETDEFMELLSELMESRTASISTWLEHLSDEEFSAVIATLKNYLETHVNHFHDVFSGMRDSATGAAVHVLRGLSLFVQDNLELEYSNDVEPYDQSPELLELFEFIHAPDFVSTKLTVAKANKVAKELGLSITFRKANLTNKAKKTKKSSK